MYNSRCALDARHRRVPSDCRAQPATEGVPCARQVCGAKCSQASQHRGHGKFENYAALSTVEL